MFQNPEYNHGRPWFVNFRPLLHSPFALTDKELDTYVKLDKKVKAIEEKIENLKSRNIDTYDIEIELNIAKVPNQPDRSSGGIASDIIEYPTGKTHPNPAPLNILEIINIK